MGEWYKPRKDLFRNATPLRYDGDTAPGIGGLPEEYKSIAAKLGDDVLIHIIKQKGDDIPSTVEISEREWPGIKEVYVEPDHKSLQMEKRGDLIVLQLEEKQVDSVDTILRLYTK